MNDAELATLAARLAGSPVALERVHGGGNNRIYRARAGAATYALKRYPDDPVDARERWSREWSALRFLWERGERRTPRPHALDEAAGVALYEWIEGERPGAERSADLDALVAFARALHDARTHAAAAALPLAKEAVLSHAELFRQLSARLVRLERPAAGHPGLAALVADLRRFVASVEAPAGDRDLDPERRTLSPSDFGLHNALRTASGLRFLDFEYFGWDDPVKLVADLLWHPGMALNAAERAKIFTSLADSYSVDSGFRARFERAAPLFGARWATIVLGEFLPEVMARRIAAGAVTDPVAAGERQLEKAAALLARARAGAVVS